MVWVVMVLVKLPEKMVKVHWQKKGFLCEIETNPDFLNSINLKHEAVLSVHFFICRDLNLYSNKLH